MNNLNSLLIEGDIVRQPKAKTSIRGQQVCNFRIGSHRFYKNEVEGGGYIEEVSYFNVETWGRLAEQCVEKAKLGRGVRVVGRLKQERYVDASGNRRSCTKIVAESIEWRPTIKKPKPKNVGFDI